MHTMLNISLFWLTLSLVTSINGCQEYKTITLTIKQIIANPPSKNRISEVIKKSRLDKSSLGFDYPHITQISREITGKRVKVNTCNVYNKISLRPQEYEYIKKNMREKKDLYIEVQYKNSPYSDWFKIEHKGVYPQQ